VTRRSRSQPQLDLRSSTPPPPSTDDASAADAADDDDSTQNRVDKPASSTRTICYSARPDPTRQHGRVTSRPAVRIQSREDEEFFLSRDKAIAYQQAGTLTNKLIIHGARASQATVGHSLNNLVFVVYVYAFVEQR